VTFSRISIPIDSFCGFFPAGRPTITERYQHPLCDDVDLPDKEDSGQNSMQGKSGAERTSGKFSPSFTSKPPNPQPMSA
jgi:hypothetical protein